MSATGPEWLFKPAADEGEVKAPEATYAEWSDRAAHGKPGKKLRKKVAQFTEHGMDHDAAFKLAGDMIELGNVSEGGPEAISQAGATYLRHYPNDASDWNGILRDQVRRKGMPLHTIPLSAAERKAIKRRDEPGRKEAEPTASAPQAFGPVDIAAVLAGGMEERTPDAGALRTDGWALFYFFAVNVLFGAPESGKTLIALANVAHMLKTGRVAWYVDLDHNGAVALINRLIEFGVSPDRLADASRFRLYMPEEMAAYEAMVVDAKAMRPNLVIVDSLGELIPLFGGSSNDDSDYTRIHRAALTSMSVVGTAVVAIDHEAKGTDSRNYGATGTIAKKRAVDGVMLRVRVVDRFVPGKGGTASMNIVKDRHGGVRAITNTGGEEPMAAFFVLAPNEGRPGSTFEFHTGRSEEQKSSDRLEADIAFIAALEAKPTSKESLQAAVRAHSSDGKGWSNDRAMAALKAWRSTSQTTTTFPLNTTPEEKEAI